MSESKRKMNGGTLAPAVVTRQLPAALRKEAQWMRNVPGNVALHAHAIVLGAAADHIEKLEKQVLELMADAMKHQQELEAANAKIAELQAYIELHEPAELAR